MRSGVHHLDDQIRAKARVDFAFARRQFDIGQSVLAMPEFGRDQLLKKRMLRSGGNWNIAAVSQRQHSQRILQTLFRRHIARHNREGAHV